VEQRSDRAIGPAVYEIKVRGRLGGDHWLGWFDGMTLAVDERGDTVLRGPVADQAALYGLLARLRDLALPLLSVNVINSCAATGEPDDVGCGGYATEAPPEA
jgi:hypothetical protein